MYNRLKWSHLVFCLKTINSNQLQFQVVDYVPSFICCKMLLVTICDWLHFAVLQNLYLDHSWNKLELNPSNSCLSKRPPLPGAVMTLSSRALLEQNFALHHDLVTVVQHREGTACHHNTSTTGIITVPIYFLWTSGKLLRGYMVGL